MCAQELLVYVYSIYPLLRVLARHKKVHALLMHYTHMRMHSILTHVCIVEQERTVHDRVHSIYIIIVNVAVILYTCT